MQLLAVQGVPVTSALHAVQLLRIAEGSVRVHALPKRPDFERRRFAFELLEANREADQAEQEAAKARSRLETAQRAHAAAKAAEAGLPAGVTLLDASEEEVAAATHMVFESGVRKRLRRLLRVLSKGGEGATGPTGKRLSRPRRLLVQLSAVDQLLEDWRALAQEHPLLLTAVEAKAASMVNPYPGPD